MNNNNTIDEELSLHSIDKSSQITSLSDNPSEDLVVAQMTDSLELDLNSDEGLMENMDELSPVAQLINTPPENLIVAQMTDSLDLEQYSETYPVGGTDNLSPTAQLIRGFYEKKDVKKIFPFEIEDLSKIYNLEKFHYRKRREPRVLKKYNAVANAACVYGWLLQEKCYYRAKRARTYAARDVQNFLDTPIESIKVKISQINAYAYKGKNDNIASGLILAYEKFKDVHYDDLRRALDKYKIYGGDDIEALEGALNSLIKG